MDASQALADLTEISSQIEAAVLFDGDGAVQGSTLADAAAAEELVRMAGDLLAAAAAFRSGEAEVTQLEASTQDGSIFVVRDDGAQRRRHDRARSHGGSRLLRPEELPARLDRGREAEAEAPPPRREAEGAGR